MYFIAIIIFFLFGTPSLFSSHNEQCISGDYEIKENLVLTRDCVHNASFYIKRSNIVLDCNGSIIDGEGKRKIGIKIDSNSSALSNVEIRNCSIQNFKSRGISIEWVFPDRQKLLDFSSEQIYSKSPQNIRIKNVDINNTGWVGIYIDDFVNKVWVVNSKIMNSGDVGVYLEHDSKFSTIENNIFLHNGFRTHREALAIDSSTDNIISNNSFVDNFNGGIYLYRNCSEHYLKDSSQAIRKQSSDRNTIINNNIDGGKTGVWIASRQSMNLDFMECGNGYYAESKYSMDSAKDNLIKKNKFMNLQYGIIVEDDHNTLIDNRFENIQNDIIKVGSVPRMKYLNMPVKGIILKNNIYLNREVEAAIVGNAEIQEK